MPDSGLPAPYLDPSQYPDYLAAQRKSALASMLMNSLQSTGQTPSDWDSMKVVPKRGLLQNVAPLVTALMANKATKDAQQAQAQYFSGLYSGGQPQASQPATQSPPVSLAPPPADPNEQSVQPLIARNGQSFSQAVGGTPPPQQQQPATGRGMVLPGMQRGQAQALLSMMGPEKYGELLASQYKPAEIEIQMRAAGIEPNSPLGRQIAQASLAKANYIAPIDARPGGTLIDPNSRQPIFTAPQNGVQTTWTQNGPVQSPVPGAVGTQAEMTGATTGAKEANTPHYEPDPFHPGQFIVSYPPTPPALSGQQGSPANAPRGTTSNTAPKVAAPSAAPTAADLEGQKEGAKSGTVYASELAKNATGATEVRRSLSELKNLSNQAGPSGLNEGKMKLGTYMIAAGMSPESVGQFLGVDVGALQAAQKQTATLAVNTIHSMTSRGTNFDLETFMRNNPNMNMADPAAFNRVVDYMDNKAKQEIAKQKDFSDWKRGHTPDEWETGHTAHWLDKQNQDIDAGRSNSRPPLSTFWKP